MLPQLEPKVQKRCEQNQGSKLQLSLSHQEAEMTIKLLSK